MRALVAGAPTMYCLPGLNWLFSWPLLGAWMRACLDARSLIWMVCIALLALLNPWMELHAFFEGATAACAGIRH